MTSGGAPQVAPCSSRPLIILVSEAMKFLKSLHNSSGCAFFWPAACSAWPCFWVSSRSGQELLAGRGWPLLRGAERRPWHARGHPRPRHARHAAKLRRRRRHRRNSEHEHQRQSPAECHGLGSPGIPRPRSTLVNPAATALTAFEFGDNKTAGTSPQVSRRREWGRQAAPRAYQRIQDRAMPAIVPPRRTAASPSPRSCRGRP